jgi:hypothetical protein
MKAVDFSMMYGMSRDANTTSSKFAALQLSGFKIFVKLIFSKYRILGFKIFQELHGNFHFSSNHLLIWFHCSIYKEPCL